MKRQFLERYDKNSGAGENPEIEKYILKLIFSEVSEPINNRALQIRGCDYICRLKDKDYIIDVKEDYADSEGDFLFELKDRFGYSWTDSRTHLTDFILWIKNSEGKAYLIWYKDLVQFSQTKTFRMRKSYPTGEGAESKFFRLGKEIPYKKVIEFGIKTIKTKAMKEEKKYENIK